MAGSVSQGAAQRLEASLDLIEQSLLAVRKRYRFSAAEAEEIRSQTYLRLVKNNYAAFRRFQGRCSLRTYLTTITASVALDYRASRWGRKRPSRIAVEAGLPGMLLEVLLTEGVFSHREAVQMSRSHLPNSSEASLEDLIVKLPLRLRRVEVPLEDAGEWRSSDPADGPLLQAELERARQRMQKALDRSLSKLSLEDRLLLRLRFHQGLTTSQIARILGTKRRPLYRRIRRCLRTVRLDLEAKGFSGADFATLGS